MANNFRQNAIMNISELVFNNAFINVKSYIIKSISIIVIYRLGIILFGTKNEKFRNHAMTLLFSNQL